MPQLYAQTASRPDPWLIGRTSAGLCTLQTACPLTVTYSGGSPAADTIAAGSAATVYGGSAATFDASADVWVVLTVAGSGALQVAKEADLAAVTGDWAGLARVVQHSTEPYQPQAYLAAGGLGLAPPTSFPAVSSAAGAGVVYVVSGSEPAGWPAASFDDSAWTPALADPTVRTITIPGAAFVTAQTGVQATGAVFLLRHAFVAPAGVITSASLGVFEDNYARIYLNGTLVYSYDREATDPSGVHSADVLAALLPGARNVLAVHMQNSTLPSPGPYAVIYQLTLGGASSGGVPDPGGHAGDLLTYHAGAWTDLPIGTTGQELTVVSGAPAWATPPAGGVTSVQVAAPSPLSATGGPITASGTITLAWASGQTANRVLASPNGSSGAVSLRALVGNDIPVDASTIISSAGVITGNYQAGSGVSISGNTISATGSGGSVTSVALSAPALFSVAGSPVTGSGTLALTYASGQKLPTAQGGTGVDGSSAANGALLIGNGSGYTLATITAGSGISVVNSSGGISIAASGGTGTVTSVALSLPGIFSLSGSPITTSGTLSVTLANESAATVFAGPASGSAAAPTFRALQGSDLPPAAAAGGHIHAHGHFL